VLQGQETVENGKIKATWLVVPGGGARVALKTALEKGQTRTLDYFEWCSTIVLLALALGVFLVHSRTVRTRANTMWGLQIESNYPKRLRRLSVQVTILAS
jgi:hypothetical protein